MNRIAFNSTWLPRMLSIMRIVVGFLFMGHGGQKLFNFPPSPQAIPHLPPLMLVAGVLEFFGGFLILMGLFTQPVALVLAGEMAVAYSLAHAPHGFWPMVNKGELAVLYCFVFLYLATAGAGPWSLDRLRRRRGVGSC